MPQIWPVRSWEFCWGLLGKFPYVFKKEEPEQMVHSSLSGHDVAMRTNMTQQESGKILGPWRLLVGDDITFQS